MSEDMMAGHIVLVDWRSDAMQKEPNKLRPCVVIEDHTLLDGIVS